MRCDCHVHVVGPIDRYPQLASRTYQAGLAPLATLRALGAARDVTRFVLVQPSFYGTDNTLLLESLDALGGHGRGVAVVGPQIAPATLDDYARRGVRGLRLNLYSTAGRADARPLPETFAALAALTKRRGWHIEVIATLDVLAQHAALIAASPVPVVIDHYGLHGDATPADAVGCALIDLLRLPHVWIKLSAPYRVSHDPLATRPDSLWLRAILEAAAGRCVWGSDWPHTPLPAEHAGAAVVAPYRGLSYQRLVDDFVDALESPELAERLLRDNPARLYGF